MIQDTFLLASPFIFVGLMLCAAFFAATETALFSLTRSQIDELADRKDAAAKRLVKLLDEPRRLLIVLLSGNTIVNIVAATIAALATNRAFSGEGHAPVLVFVLQVIAVTMVILISGEILPKLAAIRNPLQWSLRISGILVAICWVLSPITMLLVPFTDFIAKLFGVEKRRLWISEEEIKTLVEVGEEHGALEKSEKELIHSIFEFGDTTVREIMVPRTDMICLDIDESIETLLDTIRKYGHSRIPIYENTRDNIIGILHAKDLLPHYPLKEAFDLRSLLRKPYFVPEAKLIQELLKEFQEQRLHLAIAVDEYGGTAGLVTFEDVIEEIVGEIQDEHDMEHPLWTRIDERTIVIEAKVDVETTNHVLGEDVIPTDEDYETLGGFLLAELGEFPEAATKVEYHNFEFIIEEVRAHRLGRIRVVHREALEDLQK